MHYSFNANIRLGQYNFQTSETKKNYLVSDIIKY